MIDFLESDEESYEQRRARLDVLAWWKSNCGWGKLVEIADPIISDGPGIYAEFTEVEESPSRKRSHGNGDPTLHKCHDCDTMLSGQPQRCDPCRRAHRGKGYAAYKARVAAAGKA